MAKLHLKLVTPTAKNEQLPRDGAATAICGPANT
jgi:hypothetical protein